MRKNVAICHFRIGKTDGVSLEIAKRKKALVEMGYDVKLISGPRQEGCDYIIPLLEFDTPDILKIRHNAFENFEDFRSDGDFEDYIDKIAYQIKAAFLKIHNSDHFEYLFLHNIFTHGRHIASAKAFYEIAQETSIKIISVNHDFYWVGSYKDIYKPTTAFVKNFLQKYVPPVEKKLTHVEINTINKLALEERIGQNSLLLPDTFDFDQDPWVRDEYNADFLDTIGVNENDLLVLQATRIAKRKGIELAVEFVSNLEKQQSTLVGKTLYNGKKLTDKSNVVLILAGYAEDDSLSYKAEIEKLIKKRGVKAFFIADLIAANRRMDGNKKYYSLWDTYVYSDIVTFPSLWEGWGNQFIEAVFAKKPIVIFEYPVFKTDIKGERYNVVSLGDQINTGPTGKLVSIPTEVTNQAVAKATRFLTSSDAVSLLEKNFEIGKANHSDTILIQKLEEILITAEAKNKSY